MITEDRAVLGGVELFYKRAADVGGAPVLYVHGVPSSSDDWDDFLARTGGIAPDLPGFGRSAKPRARRYDMEEHCDVLEALLDHLQVDRYRLVVHDFGGLALAMAQRAPQRLERLVITNSVCLFGDYKWHAVARIWRTPRIGEASMMLSTKESLTIAARPGTRSTAAARKVVSESWPYFDKDTRHAILKLYRSADPDVLAAAGAQLSTLTCPALVVWGQHDPYVGPEWAQRYADVLPGSGAPEIVADAGHWPWIDQPQTLDRICDFLAKKD